MNSIQIRQYMPEDHAHVCTLNSQRIFEDFPNGFLMGMKHSRRNQMIMALIFLLGSMFWSLIGGFLLLILALCFQAGILFWGFYGFLYSHMHDKELKYYAEAPHKFLVATNTSGQILGYICFRKISADAVEMHRFYVDLKHRGCGIGRRLVQELIEMASQDGFTSMYIETNRAQTSAIKLY